MNQLSVEYICSNCETHIFNWFWCPACKTSKTIIEAKDYHKQDKPNKSFQNLFSCFRFKNTNKVQPTVAVEQQEETQSIHEVTRYKNQPPRNKEIHEVVKYKNQPLRIESYV